MRRAEWLVERPWRLVLLVLLIAAPLLALAEIAAADTQRRVGDEQRETLRALAVRGAEATASRTGALLDKLVGAATTSRLRGAIGLTARPDSAAARQIIEPPDLRELSFQLDSFHSVMRDDVATLFALDGAGFVLETDPPGGTADGRITAGTDFIGSSYAKAILLNADSRFVGVDPGTASLVVAVPLVQQARYTLRTSRAGPGALVAELRPNFLETSLRSLVVSVGDLYVVDSQGRLLARLNGESSSLQDLRQHPAVAAALAGRPYLDRSSDPMSNISALIATAPVGDFGWHIVAVAREDALQAEIEAGLAQQRGLRFGLIAVLVLGSVLVGGASSAAIRRRRETAEALERQTAVSEVLRIISRSPFELDAVFKGVIASAVRLCGADNGTIMRIVDGRGFSVAHAGLASDAPPPDEYWSTEGIPLDRTSLTGRVLLERRSVAITDIFSEPDLVIRDLTKRKPGPRLSLGINHSMLGVPLLRSDEVVGVILLRRREIRPFSDNDVALAETFADQAVIAIENVRLFNETKEALAQQTAVAGVLSVINSSRFDQRPVLDTVVERAAQLCEAQWAAICIWDGSAYVTVAWWGPHMPADYMRLMANERQLPTREHVVGRVALLGKTVQIEDVLADPEYSYPAVQEAVGYRTVLGIPLLRDGAVVGVFAMTRKEVRPFSPRQIALVETFAQQAVIAIENVRLFNETKESLGQQTALSDVLRTISRSAFDLDAVLQTIVERAAALVGAEAAAITRRDGDEAVVLAQFGSMLPASQRAGTRIPVVQRTAVGRAILTRKRQYIADAAEDPDLGQSGPRTRLVIPFLRDGTAIGTLGVTHNLPKPIGDREMKMLEAFADQAAIAIENVRLFNETKESLERQTALAEILRVIASSPSDQQPVLDAIALNVTRYCGAADALVLLVQGDAIKRVAHHGILPTVADPNVPLVRTAVPGRAILDRRTVQVTDITGPEGDEFPTSRLRASELGDRGLLATPLLREGKGIGVILLRRRDTNGFSASQVQLVEAFADQAVIAIENVRLFNETKEALKQRTATSEILRVISETLGDPQPVMQAIVDTVLAVCSADSAGFFRRSGDDLILRAVSGTWRGPRPSDVVPQLPFHGDSIVVSALEEGRYQHVADTSTDPRYDAAAQWSRTRLAVPVLRGSETLGVIRVGRAAPGGFSEREIRLVEGFAEQAAIAFENARLFNETKESLDQQIATAELLEVISRSTNDLTPVFDAVLQKAIQLCGADNATIRLRDGDEYRHVATLGMTAEMESAWVEYNEMRSSVAPGRETLTQRVATARTTVQIVDILSNDEFYPRLQQIEAERPGMMRGTMLGVPLLREGQVIGVILARRVRVRAFSDRQIQLLETFARQATIAIENVRLFNETKEALERQSAVAEVLGEISQSGFQLQPVLESVIEAATKLCAAQQGFIYRREGSVFRLVVAHGITPEFKAFTEANPINPMGRGTVTGRVAEDRRTVHIPDVLADPEYTYWEAQRLGNFRAILGVPMMRDEDVIGVMLLWRTESQPFTDEEIALVATFANQATIAIENVRLFGETKEALERQTATADVLRVIASSPTEVQPVLDAIADRAMRLCAADGMVIRLLEGEELVVVARAGTLPAREMGQDLRIPLRGDTLTGAALLEARTIHVADVQASNEYPRAREMALRGRHRTIAAVPLLREGRAIGVFSLARQEVKPYSERELALVATFADQAVIAIENVRLFKEIRDKSRQLEVASRHKSEFLANMSHELRTPLNAIIGFSEVLVQGLFGEVNEKQREYLQDVIGSGQHLLSLINDILDLSKIEAGRMELELSTFSFRNALQSGVTIVRERAARSGIGLNIDVLDEVGQVEADERKVKQILYNLLSNAVKFTPDGGRVNVTVRRDNGDVRVDIQDNGIGIAEADQARIFEEFQQVGRERSREGTGLGLTLTKRFVELHGGRIWLESAPGQGSTFTFTLPLRQAAPVRA